MSKYDLATKSASGGVLLKKSFLKIPQISEESTCVGVFCEIFKKTYFEEHLRTAVSFAIYQWNTYNFLKKYIVRTYGYCFIFNSVQDRPFRGCWRMGAGGKKDPSQKYVAHFLQWWNVALLYLTQRRYKNYINNVTRPWVMLTSAFFHRESAVFVISRNADKVRILIRNF